MANRNRRFSKAARPGLPWIWMLISFLGGGLLASYLAHVNKLPDFFEHQVRSKPKITTPANRVAKKVPQFDFYRMLPAEQKVEKIPVASPKPDVRTTNAPPLTPKPEPMPSASEGRFFLQAAAFHSVQEADQLKAQLILAGYDVQVKKVVKNKIQWYRVLIGPFNSKASAEITRNKLTQQHVKTHLITAESSA